MRRKKKAKKVWGASVLTVVVRGKPGERILQLCKIGVIPGGDPSGAYFNCMREGACMACYSGDSIS